MDDRRRQTGDELFEREPRREVQDELEFHLEQRVREFRAAGMDEESAQRAALERIGNLERVRGECTELLVAERRSAARRNWLSDLQQDLRFAVRTAGRAPLFTMMAIVTLALGIGANSAVFGVVKSVLLDALPYADADRLVRVSAAWDSGTDFGGPLSAGTVQDVRERQRSFAPMAAFTGGGPEAVLQGDARPAVVQLSRVQPGFFETLGVNPAFGRTFREEDAATDTAHVVILTHRAWQQYFDGDPEILGRSISLNDIAREVVGVLPREFVPPMERAEFYLPLNLGPTLNDPVAARGSHWLRLVGRLKPDVTLEAAAAEIGVIGRALAAEHPQDNNGLALRAQRLRDSMTGDTRTPLLVLMGSASLVLLIACANIASALLSRTLARRREFAVRVSLGAARGRLVRQLLAESVLLALAGAAAGLLLAHVALGALRGASLDLLPDYASLTLDRGAVAFTFLLALITGATFGLTPALSAGRAEPQAVLRDESRGASGSRRTSRLRGALVAAQVALCLSLLTGGGLLARSVWLMASAQLGFDTTDALVFTVPLPNARYGTLDAQNLFRDQMAERFAAIPGVTAVTVTNFLPTRVYNSNGLSVVGRERAPGENVPFLLTTGVAENFFEVMGVPLMAGRAFTTSDHPGSPPVMLISEAASRRFWPGGDALGAHVRLGPNPEATPIEVVGIVRDVRTNLAEAEAEPMVYMPLRQGWWGTTFVLRTEDAPRRYLDAAGRELAAVDPTLPVSGITTLEEVIDEALAPRRLPMLLMLSFAMLALLLACIGIYALFANMALAREREFGVRMALGSSRAGVAVLVLREGALWMGVGLLAGAVGVVAVSRALRSLVYGIAPLDHVSVAAAVGALLLSAAVALAIPVIRATRADPLSAMRS